MFQAPTDWKCTIIKHEEEKPYIFLLDEYHKNGLVIADNIEIAKTLIHEQGVYLIGVEDYSSKNDPYTGNVSHAMDYNSALLPDANCITDDETPFADALLKCGIPVVGVDSSGCKDDIILSFNGKPFNSDYPANLCRSKNFVLSLFVERAERRLNCNVLINCGSDHNAHIFEFTEGAKPRPDKWPHGTYIRLRSPHFL